MINTTVASSAAAFSPPGSAGCVVLTLSDPTRAGRAEAALLAQGLAPDQVIRHTAADQQRCLSSLLARSDDLTDESRDAIERTASTLAGQRCEWLIVSAPDDAARRRVVGVAQDAGARVAIHYDQLVFDDLR